MAVSADYDAELEAFEIETYLTEISAFVETPAFRQMLGEMRALPSRDDRHRFVHDIVINDQARRDRGIVVPDGIIVQRSVFMDGRPTLFCVTKYLTCGTRKVTVTFDDGY